MPGVANLVLAGTVVGIPSGQQDVAVTWNLPNANPTILSMTLSIGDNEVTVPSGASMMLIIPPDGNAVTIHMKDTPSDAGISIHPQVGCFRSIGAGVSTIYLNVASLLTGPVALSFY